MVEKVVKIRKRGGKTIVIIPLGGDRFKFMWLAADGHELTGYEACGYAKLNLLRLAKEHKWAVEEL